MAEAGSGWVQCSDRLPLPENGNVLGWNANDKYAIHMLAFLDKGRFWDAIDGLLDVEVTHWMPLPGPPEAKS